VGGLRKKTGIRGRMSGQKTGVKQSLVENEDSGPVGIGREAIQAGIKERAITMKNDLRSSQD